MKLMCLIARYMAFKVCTYFFLSIKKNLGLLDNLTWYNASCCTRPIRRLTVASTHSVTFRWSGWKKVHLLVNLSSLAGCCLFQDVVLFVSCQAFVAVAYQAFVAATCQAFVAATCQAFVAVRYQAYLAVYFSSLCGCHLPSLCGCSLLKPLWLSITKPLWLLLVVPLFSACCLCAIERICQAIFET